MRPGTVASGMGDQKAESSDRQSGTPLKGASGASNISDSGYKSAPQTPMSLSISGDPTEVVRENFSFIRDSICVDTMMDHMYSVRCIQDPDKDEIEQIRSCFRKTEKFIKCLLKNDKVPGFNVCHTFLQKLKDCENHNHVYENLKKKRENIRSDQEGLDRGFHIRRDDIATHRSVIAEELDIRDVCDKLFESKVFSDKEHDHVCEKVKRIDQAFTLLFILEEKTEQELDKFLDILEENQPSVLDILKQNFVPPKKVDKATFVVQQNFRYVVDYTCSPCDIMIDILLSKESISEKEKQIIEQFRGRKRSSKLIKTVLSKGKAACRQLLAGYEYPDIDAKFVVKELQERQRRRSQCGGRIPKTKLLSTVLQSHQAFLLEELGFYPLIDVLLEEFVFDISDHDRVEEEQSRRNKSHILLTKLEKLSFQKFQIFLWILENNHDYNYVLTGLQDPNMAEMEQEPSLKIVVENGVEHTHFTGKLPDGTYILKMRTKNNLADIRPSARVPVEHSSQEAVEGAMLQAVEHDETEVAKSCYSFSGMKITGVEKGSIVIHLQPITDNAIQNLLDACSNHSLQDFVRCILERCNLGKDFEGQEIMFSVELSMEKEIPKTIEVKGRKYSNLIYPPENNITKLPHKVYMDVVRSLDNESDKMDWRVFLNIASKTNDKYVFSSAEVVALSNRIIKSSDSPAKSMLTVLEARGMTIKELIYILDQLGMKAVLQHLMKFESHDDKRVERIKRNFAYLEDELEPKWIAKQMVAKGCFTEEECDGFVNSREPRRAKVKKFLNLLLKKAESDQNVTDMFVQTLEDIGYYNVIEDLMLKTDPEEVHDQAEKIKCGIIENYDKLLAELDSYIITKTLDRCGVSEEIRKQHVSVGGKRRRVRVHNFLKEILSNDEHVLIFTAIMKDEGMEEYLQPKTRKPDKKFSSKQESLPSVIFESSFKVSFEKSDGDSGVNKEERKKIVVKFKSSEVRNPKVQTIRNLGTSWSQKRKIVAAIDFGTTFSGIAYSFETEKENITVIKKKVQGASYGSEKMPTALLISPTKEVVFGWEAKSQYKLLTEDEEHAEYYYFSKFKMELYKSEDLNRETEILDSTGKRMPALEVFKLSIQKLKDMLLKSVDLPVDDIFWVITVPAIWGDRAKQFMGEAAVTAGIQRHRMTLALEPEVAAIFVKQCNMERKEDKLMTYATGRKYLVMDLGGGTADLTSMQVTETKSLKQLHMSCGGHYGGEVINKQFWTCMKQLLTHDVVEEFRLHRKSDYLEMEAEFESRKRTLKEYKAVTITLPLSLIDLMQKHLRKSPQELIGKDNPSVTMKGQNHLVLSLETVRTLFESALLKLIDEARQLVSKDTDIIMVGGFSNSRIVQMTIQQQFPENRVIIPPECELAVLKGAVYYGHNPECISSRVCKFTYGVEVQRYFLKGDPEALKIDVEGSPYCDKVFAKIVTIGEEVGIEESKFSEDITSLKTEAMSMKLKIFQSTDPDPLYVVEESCTQIGLMRVQMKSKNQNIKVLMRFGETELLVEGRDAQTNELIDGAVKLDLLTST